MVWQREALTMLQMRPSSHSRTSHAVDIALMHTPGALGGKPAPQAGDVVAGGVLM